MNLIVLIGHLGKDPELKTVGSDQVCKFSMATSERWKTKDGEKKEETTWHNIEVWGPQAGPCAKYLKKGSQASVTGSQKRHEYEKDGVKKDWWFVRANRVQFLDSKGSGESGGGGGGGGGDGGGRGDDAPSRTDDDIPF